MQDLQRAEQAHGGIPAADISFDAKGFTRSDMALLRDAHHRGVAGRGWGRAEFVSNESAQYMAIWQRTDSDRQASIQVIRFSKTGTYAMLLEGRIVANDKRLSAILPVLAAAGNAAAQ